MRILILCRQPNEIKNNQEINTQCTIYAYHFTKWLSQYDDCELTYDNIYRVRENPDSLEEHDFCFILFNRGVKTIGTAAYTVLREKIKHQIITICGTNKIIDQEDILLFTMGKRKPKALRFYWGADFDMLKPEKPETVTILVDHKYYGKATSKLAQRDHTQKIIDSLLSYKKSGKNIVIKHIGSGEVHTVEEGYKITDFRHGSAMDFREIYKYYNEAHIYVVTHPESFGLSTIESAASGSLIVQPEGYIKPELIKKMHHYTVRDINNINWDEIISRINIDKSRKMAERFQYKNMVQTLYQHMKDICSSDNK